MNKLILILLLISFPVMVIHSNPLKKYIWKNRVIVTFSPNKNNTDRSHFLNSINKNLCEYNSRNIIHIDLLFNENNKEIEKFKSFFEKLSLSPSEFRLILFGKDGGIKLNSRKTSLEEIFSLIDTMPMRQEEMLNDKC
jgi:hypothetical protein|tara:strand:- start:164 stop:577 length:414 start_codon:yes stop_codon:yes gene_type:complete